MIPKVIEVKPIEGYKLWLRFQDGVCGTVDRSGALWGPVFEPPNHVLQATRIDTNGN